MGRSAAVPGPGDLLAVLGPRPDQEPEAATWAAVARGVDALLGQVGAGLLVLRPPRGRAVGPSGAPVEPSLPASVGSVVVEGVRALPVPGHPGALVAGLGVGTPMLLVGAAHADDELRAWVEVLAAGCALVADRLRLRRLEQLGGAASELAELARRELAGDGAARAPAGHHGDPDVDALLLEGDRAEVAAFVDRWLGSLRAYDRTHRSELEATLAAYLATGGSIVQAAAGLHVHTSTLKYRLGRIRQVLGRDLAEPEVRFNLELAIRARRVLAAASGDLTSAQG